jgi:aldose 1-epimerase
VARAEDSITMEHILHPAPGYPWRLLHRCCYSLGPQGLRVEHTVTNQSDQVAPFGMGAHPYVLVPGVALADLELRLKARIRLLVDSRLLPIGAARVAGTEWDYSMSRRIGSASVNAAFGDIGRDSDGLAEVSVIAPDGRWVKVWADRSFLWWQLYTGDALSGERRRRSIAIEPMTCPPDALRSGRDLIRLEPGIAWTGAWGIRAGTAE